MFQLLVVYFGEHGWPVTASRVKLTRQDEQMRERKRFIRLKAYKYQTHTQVLDTRDVDNALWVNDR